MECKVLCLFCRWIGKVDENQAVCPECKSEGNLIAAGGEGD